MSSQSLLLDDGLERMKKNGPKDVCYACSYEQKDIKYIQKLMLKSELIDNFYQKCEQRWNDHSAVLEIGNQKIEFVEVSKADDVVTYPGLEYCMRLILGITTTPWRYMGAGNDISQARPYQQQLFAETEPRADMSQPAQGSRTRSGQALRYIGIFPATFPTITVRESGIFQTVTGYTGVMFNRNVFSANPITHTVSVLPFTLASLFTFSAVTTWA